MIDPKDMKIGQAYPFSSITGWQNGDMGWCSHPRCTAHPPAEHVMVIRHYKTNSTGGTWVWYCEQHFTDKPWKTDELAPESLR